MDRLMTLEERERWLRSKDERWRWVLEKLEAAQSQPPLGRNPDERAGWAAAQLDAYETAVKAMCEAQVQAENFAPSAETKLIPELPALFANMKALRLKYEAAEKGVSEALGLLHDTRASADGSLALSMAKSERDDAFQQYRRALMACSERLQAEAEQTQGSRAEIPEG
jgi:hypothetical protein